MSPRNIFTIVAFAALAAFVFDTACTSRSYISMRVDPAFTDDDRVQLESARARWNEVTVDTHKIVFAKDGDWVLQKAAAPPGYIGWTEGWPNDRVVIEPTLSGNQLRAVALHELGHVLGLDHTKSPAIMSAPISADDLTEIDMDECRRVEACAPKEEVVP